MAKYSPQRRELIQNNAGDFYAKRRADGTFSAMDERSRSLRADIRQHAKRTVPSGFGDSGDQRRRPR